jgi:hypothetical protein
MLDQLKTAIQIQIASPESRFIASVLKDAVVFDQWTAPTDTYDVAVCIGPVTLCPPAKKRVLFVLGQMANHIDLNWDMVVVTSDRARQLALAKFGHGTKVMKLVPPVLELTAGRRRVVEEFRGLLHASDSFEKYGPSCVKKMSLWGVNPAPETYNGSPAFLYPVSRPLAWETWECAKPKHINVPKLVSLFSSLEFNSLVRGGAIGYYPRFMEDGYDIQVRRHLALGGRVICKPDPEVLGKYAKLVDDVANHNKIVDFNPTKPEIWEGTEHDYAAGIEEAIRRA